MADITYYVAMPFTRDETGAPVAGAAEECQSSTTALRRAEVLARSPGHIGAVALEGADEGACNRVESCGLSSSLQGSSGGGSCVRASPAFVHRPRSSRGSSGLKFASCTGAGLCFSVAAMRRLYSSMFCISRSGSRPSSCCTVCRLFQPPCTRI